MRMKGFCILALLAASSAYAAGLPSKGMVLAAPCAGCHGTQGASTGALMPVIGGQQQAYLAKSMRDFAAGTRPGSVMANIAKGFSNEQIDEISTTFTGWKWENSPHFPKRAVRKPTDHATCAACHGDKGLGTAEGPRIAGQARAYLKEAMLEYKAGTRNSPAMDMFKEISEGSMDQMAAYYARLR